MTKSLRTAFPDLITVHSPRPSWFSLLRRAVRKVSSGRLDIAWNYALAESSAVRLANELRSEHVDVVIAIGNSALSAFLAAHLPTVHISDATVPLMRDYYSEFSKLPHVMAETALRLDRLSVLRSRACLFSTEWAARSAVLDYAADPARVHVVPWGANIDLQKTAYREAPQSQTCNLVFIGVDWTRKGGTLAVETAMRLAAAGRPVKLHILGGNPPALPASDAIVVHGFIDKGTQDGRDQFDRIMSEASFLFVPTRQDCSPMVFAEANSYGVPVISTRTGGVADVVHEGVNGHLLPVSAGSDGYSELIWSIWADRERYDRLRKSSWARFNEALNWNSWLKACIPIVQAAAQPESRTAEAAQHGGVQKDPPDVSNTFRALR